MPIASIDFMVSEGMCSRGDTRAWALASAEYRKDIKGLYAEIPEKEGWQGQEVRELREGKWEKELEALLRKVKKTREDVESAKKSAKWKVGITR
jgi:hypothetical protein